MSEPELYMTDHNESFDLPRWQTQVEPLNSSAHASQSPYLYSGPPPPQVASQRMQPIHQGQTPTRQPRISQLLEQEHQMTPGLSPYSAGGQSQLSRSASLGANSAGLASTARMRRQQDDLEGAFTSDNQSMSGPRQQSQPLQNSYYPAGIGYQQPSLNTNPSTADTYTDMYYNGSASHPPKRLQPGQHEINTSPANRTTRSPMRAPNTPTSSSAHDPYSQQPPYSPTYAYGNPVEQRPPPAGYRSHSRNHSLVKTEPYPHVKTDTYAQVKTEPGPYTPVKTDSYGQVKSDPYAQVKNESFSHVKNETSTPPLPSAYSSQQSGQSNAGYASNLSANNYHSSYAMDTSSPHPPQGHHTMSIKASHSNPSTPLSYMHPNSSQGSHYYAQDHAMAVDPPPKRRAPGFRRVRTAHDLQPRHDISPGTRRMGTDGTYLSPLRQLTTNILDTYRICNPQFRYESTHNPRRVLTKPSKPAHNDGYDNDDYDYILYVNDWLGSDDGQKYLILDILGQGTFGQVVKCQNMKTHEIVAVKVVKNKPAYFNQSMMEVTILELLNKTCDPNDEHHILRLRDSFIHRQHLCLVFELLSSNLYELIKQNQFQGLSTQLVKVFMAQLLDALTILKDARLIHCDLKPENILLKSLQSPQIKVIDFGSACHERQTVYTYIQSRFYRSPEVLLGMSYTASIDMWSLGCIAVELFLGLPLFPGTSEYNQLTRIVEMLGMPPLSMLNTGKQTNQFFDSYEVYNAGTNSNEKRYRLKSLEQYSREHNTNEQPGKQYFKATSLPEIINTAPMPTTKSSRQAHEMEKELNNRAAFIDFCQGLLNLNPVTRWTPQQARMHPFITGEKYTKPFVPDGLTPTQLQPSTSGNADPKRPYGGLVPSQPKGTRAYTDAASYNQHLAQHQAFTAQAQSQAANTFRNPYMTGQPSQQQIPTSSYNPTSDPVGQGYTSQPQQAQAQYSGNPTSSAARGLVHQNSSGHIVPASGAQYSSATSGGGAHMQANPYVPNSRARANTINQMDSVVPPALARLQHMNQDPLGGRNLTPVLNRDDAMREWERRQAGKPPAAQPYQPLEYLQQQAEMVGSGGTMGTWGAPQRYPPPPSKLSHAYQPTIMVDDDNNTRREAVLSNVRSAATRSEGPSSAYSTAGVISSPPQAYSSNATTAGNRYPATTYTQNNILPGGAGGGAGSVPSFDALDGRRGDIGSMYVPMQPEQYQGYAGGSGAQQQQGQQQQQGGGVPAGARHVAPPAQAVPPSYYGVGVVQGQPMNTPQQQQQQQRNPFQQGDAAQGGMKDARRGNGMDTWQR